MAIHANNTHTTPDGMMPRKTFRAVPMPFAEAYPNAYNAGYWDSFGNKKENKK